MPKSLRNKINLGFGIALAIIILISIFSFASTLALISSAEERAETEELIIVIESLLGDVNAAQGAQRGYIITGDSAHLPRYSLSVTNANAAKLRLDSMVVEHPGSAFLIDSLTMLVSLRVTKMAERLALYESAGLDAVADELNGDPDDVHILEVARRIERRVRNDVATHASNASRLARRTLSVIALGGIAAVLFLGISAFVIHAETSARADAYRELHEQDVRHTQFLERLPLGVFVIDAAGQPAFANQYARGIVGTKSEAESASYTNSSFVAGTDIPYPQERLPIVRALEGVETTVEDIEVRSGEVRIPLHVSAAPIYSSDGVITGAISAFTDISERRAVERMKDELISVVSHELRTPLTSIRGALGLVGSGRLGTLNDQGKRMIEIAVTDTDRLVRLINDMLDIERMQSGRLEMHRTSCNAPALIEQAVASVRTLADAASVQLDVDAENLSLWCDSDRIVQALTNLIGNAIKFSPRDTEIRIRAFANGDHVEFRVSDHGRGIPADKIESIFERFQQVDASDAREKGGAGLGLAISRNIVVQHGGRMWAESDGATGSTFCFTLPRLSSRGRPAGDASTPRILIVEDDANLASVLSAQCDAAGMSSIRAINGTEAIRLAQERTPDLLLLDLLLPKRDGFDVVDWLRQHEQLRNLPVVVYTALELPDRDRERLALGPTEFMAKSRHKPEEVVRRVAAVLDAVRQQRGQG